jgi:flavin-dependent dehydrogenase
MYDAIVIGARCAGSPTAMLLARAGHRVLLVDRATFPSDKLSTHYIQEQGVQCLERWGLLPQLTATNCPKITTFNLYNGDSLLMSQPMTGAAYCPRRYLLDTILVEAAAEAGAEVRQAFTVDKVLFEGDRVTGITGHTRDRNEVREEAHYVIGAEGHHSLVADSVNAPKYRERESLTCGYYSYWSGVDIHGAEVHISERGGVLAFPTNDGQVCIAAGTRHDLFAEYRAGIETMFMYILDASPEFAAKVRAGKREERWMGNADQPNFFRKPWGPGWALVGDAGYMKDPTTGLGISDAFRDAELLSAALDAALSGRAPAETALAAYQEQRDAIASPMYELTLQMASGGMASGFGAG